MAIGALVGLTTPIAAQEDPAYQLIGYGETISDFLTVDDPLFDTDGTSYQVYLFEGGAGDTITIHLSSPDFNSQLIVVDSSYNPLADDQDSGGNCNAYITTVLPDSSYYVIYVNGTDAGEIGQYQLTVQAGEQPPDSDAQCRGFLGHSGVVWIGGAVEGTFGPDNATIRDEYFDVWLLPTTNGQVFTVDLVSEDVDPALILVRGFVESVASNDDGGGGCNSRIVHTPADMRPYRIVVASRGNRTPGNYILSITAGSKPLLTEPPCEG